MSFLNTGDHTRLFVKDWGGGRPVIFLHGWPLSSDSWDDQAMPMADAGFRTIAYDRRGFGRSTQPWSGYDYDTLADDLASVIEQTGAIEQRRTRSSRGGDSSASRRGAQRAALDLLARARSCRRFTLSDGECSASGSDSRVEDGTGMAVCTVVRRDGADDSGVARSVRLPADAAQAAKQHGDELQMQVVLSDGEDEQPLYFSGRSGKKVRRRAVVQSDDEAGGDDDGESAMAKFEDRDEEEIIIRRPGSSVRRSSRKVASDDDGDDDDACQQASQASIASLSQLDLASPGCKRPFGDHSMETPTKTSKR